jgi:phosphate:Na+ symporter
MLSLEMNDQIQRLYNKVNEFINWNHDFLAKDIKSMSFDDLNKSIQYENEIDDMRNKFIKASSNRLTEDSNVESELIFIDIIKHLEHIGDFSLNISQALED